MSQLIDWPTGPKVFIDSENVDGSDNELIPHRSDIYSWKNQGSIAVDFTEAGLVPQRALMKKQAGSVPEVSFDGRSDVIKLVGSATSLAFIHATGIFDIAIVLRRRGGANAGERRVFGAEPKGLAMAFTTYDLGDSIEGGVRFFFTNGVATMSDLIAKSFAFPIGEVSVLFIRGTGTALRVTRDFWNWESQTFLNAPIVGVGSADYAIGTASNVVGTEVIYAEFDLLTFAVWDRNVTAAEIQAKVLPAFAAAVALP